MLARQSIGFVGYIPLRGGLSRVSVLESRVWLKMGATLAV